MDLQTYYVVRVVQGTNGYGVIKEKEFAYIPKEQEIADVLSSCINRKNVFATVEENYRLVEVENDR